jgi:hypothetical protein
VASSSSTARAFRVALSEWGARALEYAPQLLAYARALEIAGKKVLALVVRFTVGGGIVEIAAGGAGCEDRTLTSMVGEGR